MINKSIYNNLLNLRTFSTNVCKFKNVKAFDMEQKIAQIVICGFLLLHLIFDTDLF